ncbi:hypothetical protein KWC19_000425 [Salmonella enterica subsp. enterica serovar Anatum var. 15+]|nr:hypothetical protein [Salmonella enterica subsp. enterica serovar Anatum var. 15+]
MSELAIIEIAPDMAPSIYVENGLEKFLEQIRESVKEVPDLSTAKGRARIASLAAQVSRSKTAVEKPGRDYLRHLKEAVKPAEAELRRFVSACDEMRDEVRRPLTEWEGAEKARTEALQQRLVELRALAEVIDDAGNYLPSADIQARIQEAKSVVLDESWQERAAEAGVAKDSTIQQLEASLVVAQKREHEAAELERLRKDAEEKSRLEREEKIRREAAEQAKRDAEEKHRKEQEESERRVAEERARADAAERQRKEDAERAEREKKQDIEDANLKAKQEVESKERKRLEEEKRKSEEDARRAADVEHRRAINAAAVQALIDQGIPDDWAKACVVAIARGKVPATTINY